MRAAAYLLSAINGAMKIATRPLIFGASCFCLLRTAFSSIASSASTVSRINMSTTPTNTEETAAYVPGSSSIAFITTPDEESAKKMARSLVSSKLSACVNILPAITSIYVWEDKLIEDSECLLLVKTRTDRVDDLCKHVRENHNYSVAEVISIPIDNGNPPYMDWIQRSVPGFK